MLRRTLLAGFAAVAMSSHDAGAALQSSPTADATWAHADWFADLERLKSHPTEPGHRVIALTPVDEYRQGHVPAAGQLDWVDLALVDSSETTIAEWQSSVSRLLAARGITPGTRVHIYDGGTFYAARLWWVLDVLGHDGKDLIDGGFPAWLDAGGSVETRPQMVIADAPAYPAKLNSNSLATLTDVEGAVASGTAVLVDARTRSEFEQGHIPGAVNVPFLDNAEPDSQGSWKQPADLIAMYEALGVSPDRPVIPYCSSGVRSANTWFTLKALGFPDVRLFSGSYDEWSRDPSRETETGT